MDVTVAGGGSRWLSLGYRVRSVKLFCEDSVAVIGEVFGEDLKLCGEVCLVKFLVKTLLVTFLGPPCHQRVPN